MAPLTNVEKQQRHRQLEALKQLGNETFLQWLAISSGKLFNETTPEEMKQEIDEITNLRNNWTNEEYNIAQRKIENIRIGFTENQHLLKNDINLTHTDFSNNFLDSKIAKQKILDFIKIINQIAKLSGLSTSDINSAIVEILRRNGKKQTEENINIKSVADSLSLILINDNYPRPENFEKPFVQYLKNQNLNTDFLSIFANEILEK